MPRIAEMRPAAEPSSPDQHARQRRILRAAEELGAATDLEHVQMHEVAKLAGVAIGTLYRYFPSKTHLFVGVMCYQIERMGEGLGRRRLTGDAADRVFEVLARASRGLLSKPLLATAMLKSANAANAATVTDVSRIDNTMRDVLLIAAGIEEPTQQDYAILRVLLQTWGGILASSLNGRLSMDDAEGDLRLACRALVARTSAMNDQDRLVG